MNENKVVLPKDVAEILGSFSEWGIETLFQEIIGHNRVHPETKQIIKLHEFFSGRWTFLAKALINGYEVEQTPEDKVREMYELHFDDGERSPYETGYNEGVRFGVKQTLDILGLKIEGVYT